MSGFEQAGTSNAADPMTSDHFERTLFRAAPKRFSIEFLPPAKTSSSYQHCMRICAINRGDRSSTGSDCSNPVLEYAIWRRWEDCLYLQDTLEKEYSRAAREKRTRLAQGKGVKMSNGMYKQDMASSWESLPPGPEPDSVARDVHSYLPFLTKKGTFFRPKPALVEKRQQEFQALVETLMSDDMPALIKEIRANRLVTDFFGVWRRDVEVEEKLRKKNPNAVRASITNSVFSTYFSPVSPSATSPRSSSRSTDNSPTSIKSSRTSNRALPDASSRSSSRQRSSVETLAVPRPPQPRSQSQRPRTDSSGSSCSEEVPSDSSYTANSFVPRIAAEERIVNFNHNPARISLEASPITETIPENAEVYLKAAALDGQRSIRLRRNLEAMTSRRSNRNWSVYGSPVTERFQELPPISTVVCGDNTEGRDSWQSTASGASANTFLDGLELSLPRTPVEGRQSLASNFSSLTTDSADAIVPRSPTTPVDEDSADATRSSMAVSLSDFELVTVSGEERLSMIEEFPRPSSYNPEDYARPETPIAKREEIFGRTSPAPRKQLPQILTITPPPIASRAEAFVPPSPTASDYSSTYTISSINSDASSTPTLLSASTTSSSSSPVSSSIHKGGNLSIKASHNGAIIVLKVAREVDYPDLRQRLFNKFVGQEGVPLPFDFTLTHPSKSGDDVEIASDWEWRDVADFFEGSKLILCVGSPSS